LDVPAPSDKFDWTTGETEATAGLYEEVRLTEPSTTVQALDFSSPGSGSTIEELYTGTDLTFDFDTAKSGPVPEEVYTGTYRSFDFNTARSGPVPDEVYKGTDWTFDFNSARSGPVPEEVYKGTDQTLDFSSAESGPVPEEVISVTDQTLDLSSAGSGSVTKWVHPGGALVELDWIRVPSAEVTDGSHASKMMGLSTDSIESHVTVGRFLEQEDISNEGFKTADVDLHTTRAYEEIPLTEKSRFRFCHVAFYLCYESEAVYH
jgi:hypothetical protein